MTKEGCEPRAADHDFSCEALVSSVLHNMHLCSDPGESLYSGGPQGNGISYVSVHDRTLDPSSGLKHAAHFHEYLIYITKEQNSLLAEEDNVDLIKVRSLMFHVAVFLVLDKPCFSSSFYAATETFPLCGTYRK